MNSFTQKDTNASTKIQNPVLWFFVWLARRPGIWFLMLLIALALPTVVLITTVLIPAAAFTPLHKALAGTEKNDTLSQKKVAVSSDQEEFLFDILNKEQRMNFIQNRLLLSRQDSIYLVLNLQDSLLDIEIKGLPVQRCRLHGISASPRLKVADHDNLQAWLSTPFTLSSEIATIPKVPMLLVDAPKDTTEAASLPKKPMEPEKTVVYFTLLFDKNLVIEIAQTEEVLPEETELLHRYYSKYDSIFQRTLLQKIIHPMPENLPIHIKLRMNEADARAIYRSIPHANFAKLIINPLDEIR
jgi:hypothetical protein